MSFSITDFTWVASIQIQIQIQIQDTDTDTDTAYRYSVSCIQDKYHIPLLWFWEKYEPHPFVFYGPEFTCARVRENSRKLEKTRENSRILEFSSRDARYFWSAEHLPGIWVRKCIVVIAQADGWLITAISTAVWRRVINKITSRWLCSDSDGYRNGDWCCERSF